MTTEATTTTTTSGGTNTWRLNEMAEELFDKTLVTASTFKKEVDVYGLVDLVKNVKKDKLDPVMGQTLNHFGEELGKLFEASGITEFSEDMAVAVGTMTQALHTSVEESDFISFMGALYGGMLQLKETSEGTDMDKNDLTLLQTDTMDYLGRLMKIQLGSNSDLYEGYEKFREDMGGQVRKGLLKDVEV